MAGRAELKCIGPSYALADRKAGCQRSVNMYMQQVEGLGEDKPVVLSGAPGWPVFSALTGATIRGSYKSETGWYVVAGAGLYRVTTAGVYTALGTLSSSSGFVSLKQGSNQLLIVDGANGYTLDNTSGVFAVVSSEGWRGSNWAEELDGYFILVAPGTDQFYLSAIDDGKTYDALDFSSADSVPGPIITHRVRLRELHLLKAKCIEIWVDSGDPDFPLVRYNSTPIDVGVVGPRAACIAADNLVWVGQTDRGRGYVYAMRGHQPQRISTQAVEEALSASTDISQASLWTYQDAGNEFVGVNAPGLPTTWVYDFASQQWHERGEIINGAWSPLRIDQVTSVDGSQYGAAGSTLYRMDSTVNTIGTDPMLQERTWPHLMAPSMEPVAYRGVQLGCSTGGGGTVTLEISNDGGYTFGPPLIRSLGAVGRWMQTIRWLMLGAAVDRVFRLRFWGAAQPPTIHSAAVDA